jgi:hypothetical protein
MDLCRDTSRILNTDAPRQAALVKKPARSEWAPKSVALISSLEELRRSEHLQDGDTPSIQASGIVSNGRRIGLQRRWCGRRPKCRAAIDRHIGPTLERRAAARPL